LVYKQRIYIYIYISAYFLRSLYTKHCFKVTNYKIIPWAENLSLCMTAKFNKNEMMIDMQFFKYVEKQTLIILISFYNRIYMQSLTMKNVMHHIKWYDHLKGF
jgi:hypothetical protein